MVASRPWPEMGVGARDGTPQPGVRGSALAEDRHSPVLPPRKPVLPRKGQVSMPTTHYTNNAPTQLPGPARRNPKEGHHLVTPDSPAQLAGDAQRPPATPSPEAGPGRSLLQPPSCN